jgi:hypothetical protein
LQHDWEFATDTRLHHARHDRLGATHDGVMREGHQTRPPLIHRSTQAAIERDYAGLSADQMDTVLELENP